MNYRVEDIAQIYNNILGNSHFNVEVNCNLKTDGDRTQAVLFAARRPFSISGLKAETLEINIEFYINVRQRIAKLDVLDEISKILGTHTGTFESQGVEYSFNSFLEFGRPTSAPLADMGNFTQVIFVNGSCYISAIDGGVKMSNDIETYLTFNNIRGRVYPKVANVNNIRDVDAPTKANENESSAQIKTQGIARSLTIYDLRDEICQELEKYIEVQDSDSDPNEPIIIERVYPGFTVTKHCVLTSGTIIEVPGSFLCIDLTLQKQVDES